MTHALIHVICIQYQLPPNLYPTQFLVIYLFTVATNCTDGNVRLAGGLEHTEGRVEVCVQGKWRGVCGTNWNYQDAFVVCRQLGYPATGL